MYTNLDLDKFYVCREHKIQGRVHCTNVFQEGDTAFCLCSRRDDPTFPCKALFIKKHSQISFFDLKEVSK